MRRRNPRLNLKKWLPGLAILGLAAVAVVEAPKLGLTLPGGSHPTMAGPFGDINKMRAANPNFDSQQATWQALRTARGQDPQDWNAFVLYQTQIGAPNPGSLPPAIWWPMVSTN